MADEATKAAANKARQILGSAGIRHTIGTGADRNGSAQVVVDVPATVDRETVREKLGSLDANVLIRQVRGTIVGH